MQKISHTLILLLLGFFLLPQFSLAADSVNKESIFLYAIKYKIGFEKYDVMVPINTVRHPDKDNNSFVGYDILQNGNLRTLTGDTKSIVLSSNAKVKDGQYFVPKGEVGDFTLVTFLTVPEDRMSSTTSYALKISSLPFTMMTDGIKIDGYLNKSELNSFISKKPLIEIKK